MRIVAALAMALSIGALSTSAAALPVRTEEPAPDPVRIAEWSLAKISAMGAEIYRQDVAAWVSTDVLMAHFANAEPSAGMRGWIVIDEGEDQLVRYVRDDGGILKSAYDIRVRAGVAGPVAVVDEALTDAEKAQFRARQTAIENIGRLRCSARMNAVVIDDPDSDGWLVWLLTATSDAAIIPMGGHYRFTISADGASVVRRDMLSNGCLNMPRTDGAEQTEGLVVSQIVSNGPVETHVFLSIQNRLPIFVVAQEQIFRVAGPEITKVEQ